MQVLGLQVQVRRGMCMSVPNVGRMSEISFAQISSIYLNKLLLCTKRYRYDEKTCQNSQKHTFSPLRLRSEFAYLPVNVSEWRHLSARVCRRYICYVVALIL